MASKHPAFAQNWGPSEQPDRLRIDKAPLRAASIQEYLASAGTLLAALPFLLARLALVPARRITPPTATNFIGVAVSPDPVIGDHLPDLVAELGVRRLLLRVPVWERANFATYRRFADRFPACEFVLAVMQDRGSVRNLAQWRQDLRNILLREPDNARVLNALGYTLADRTQRYQEALGYIKRALELNPQDAATLDSIGWVQYRLGNTQEAVQHLRSAYKLDANAEIAAHLGEVLWVRGEREAARKIWDEALKSEPQDEILQGTMKRFQAI